MTNLAPWIKKPEPAAKTLLQYLVVEPADMYHKQRGIYLSSHMLGDFRKSPFLYHEKKEGRIKDQDSAAFVVGRAAHTLILEGPDVYWKTYGIGGPINPKTEKPYGSDTKAYQEWVVAQGRPCLTGDEDLLVQKLYTGVRKHPRAVELISQGSAEGVLRTQYGNEPCQSRYDWVNPDHGIVDLKTCDNLDYFENDARKYGYVYQMSFYRSLATCVTGLILPVHMIAIEKREPFRCGVWRIGVDVLGLAEQENLAAIQRLQHCRATDAWPTGYEEVRSFDWIK